MYRAVMGSLFLERAHMGKILTSSNISYRTIHGHLSTSAKLAMPFFSGDTCYYNKRKYKVMLQLTRDSNAQGDTKEVKQEENSLGTLISASDNSDIKHSFNSEEGECDSNVLKHADKEEDAGSNAISGDGEIRSSLNNVEDGNQISGDTTLKGTIVAGLLLFGLVGGFGAVSYIYRAQINDFLVEFSDILEGYGAAGYALFVAAYAGLEILAIPAIPLTMSAGLLFGTVTGTILVSIAGTIAATVAFLIARYLARDRILKLAEGNKQFLAIDKAIGENGFRVVALLRLSPLLPFALGNYLYGLTSVKIVPYILGSWLGMLPGTWAYVSAGAVGRAIIQQETEKGLHGGPQQFLTLGVGLLITIVAATYVTRLAKDAMKDLE